MAGTVANSKGGFYRDHRHAVSKIKRLKTKMKDQEGILEDSPATHLQEWGLFTLPHT